MSTEFTTARQLWEHQVEHIVRTGYYANRTRWHNFFHEHIEPTWLRRLGMASDVDLIKHFALRDSVLAMIHLSARGYRRVGEDRKAPRFKRWPPFADAPGSVQYFHAFPAKDIARMIGMSPSAIRRAIDTIRDKKLKDGSHGGIMGVHALLGVCPLPNGVLVDVVLTREDGQLKFSFPAMEYGASKQMVVAARIGNSETNDVIRSFCDLAISNIAPVSVPTIAITPSLFDVANTTMAEGAE